MIQTEHTKGSAMWLFHFFIKRSASSALHTQLASEYKARKRITSKGNTEILTSRPKCVSYLLQTYRTDENIAHTKDEKRTFIKLHNKTALQYTAELVAETLCCGDIYEEQDFMEFFIIERNKSNKQRMIAH